MGSPSCVACVGPWQPCCLLHQERNKTAAQELATLLLSLPAPASVQQQAKSLLASLHTSRSAYHSHKVIGASSATVGLAGLTAEQARRPLGPQARLSRSQVGRGGR